MVNDINKMNFSFDFAACCISSKVESNELIFPDSSFPDVVRKFTK